MALENELKNSLNEALNSLKIFLSQFEKAQEDTKYREAMNMLREQLLGEPFDQKQLAMLQNRINSISENVFKTYLPKIKEEFLPCPIQKNDPSISDRRRLLKITRWVKNPNERDIDKLKNVYNILSSTPCRFALIFDRKVWGCEIYAAVYSTDKNPDPFVADAQIQRFRQALRGNFPGVRLFPKNDEKRQSDIADAGISQKNAVAIVTNVATEKSENYISQGIEKLLDAYTPSNEKCEYSLMLLCEPVPAAEIERQRNSISQYYTVLSPFITWQKNTNGAETLGMMTGASTGQNVSGSINLGVPHIANVSGSYGVSRQDQVGTQDSYTKGTGTTLTYTNHQVKSLLERLDEQMKRLEQCEALGMWRFAAYVLSDEYTVAENIAQMYRSLTQGDASYIEKAAVNVWDNVDGKNTDKIKLITTYLERLEHPLFRRDPNNEGEIPVCAAAFISGTEVAQALNMPRKSVSGLPVFESAEFARDIIIDAYHDVPTEQKTIAVGHIIHMRNDEETTVSLRAKELTSHTFITGSTGSGKSNTIYTLLDKLCLSGDRDTHFLVVEPAKGEYKDVLGGYDGVSVYGTNPRKSNLLRLNPFSFPDDIQVFEHIDRLVEIFNACWPMYAAMPAVLKDAIEAAYVECGWSLAQSVCTPLRFPTFSTVMKKVKEVIDKDYSADTKGDYVGALVTRLKSLTNGINGQIFCAEDEIANGKLFDENVIVDLSRVGSMETKSLLMGILVMKLQEYRMSQGGMNEDLKHITVLEEAHNLLRCTSSEQTQESSNLQGKSVEMLANAIAEMRTYGEGFMIADQSPGLMDMSVIRNTNTKIIMRLPDESDRILVGRAASLNDSQITELARLERGVAAVFQNDWLEPVLCRVDLFDDDNHSKRKPFTYQWHGDTTSSAKEKLFKQMLFGATDCEELSAEEVDQIKRWIDYVNLGRDAKELLLKTLHPNKKLTDNEQGFLLYCLIKGKSLIQQQLDNTTSPDAVQSIMNSQIADMLGVSLNLAEEIRKRAFLYAAHQVEEDTIQYNDLLYYGGVR